MFSVKRGVIFCDGGYFLENVVMMVLFDMRVKFILFIRCGFE